MLHVDERVQWAAEEDEGERMFRTDAQCARSLISAMIACRNLVRITACFSTPSRSAWRWRTGTFLSTKIHQVSVGDGDEQAEIHRPTALQSIRVEPRGTRNQRFSPAEDLSSQIKTLPAH